ncbi:LysR family transcriptional regulator [Listeria weihenstephanensis]|uniref:LysR family transcriptional regulator n=1 Tax=Listeria weihenstephanensis TaxID=1006155 RepID=A0A841Z434_9LIST|nr:LysR family transcriptional regulator [Listeria weihenstephanensis]MBC1500030.1 LysR family transcriptional regulator [Listeria weihenstephanensis]
MDIRVLRYFLAVAHEENISAAAKILHVSQPTLSRQLKELEEELGVILFIRGNRKISLTEDGLYLVNQAKEIVAMIDKTASNIKKAEKIRGDIYIGGGESDGMRLIAKVAKELIANYPDVHVHLFSGNAEQLLEKLDNGLLDFGMIIGPIAKQKYSTLNLHTRDQWGVLMRKDCSLAKKTSIRASDIKNVPLITSNQTGVADKLSEWLNTNLDEYNIVGTYNLLYNASLLVEEHAGYALCLDKIINTTGGSELCFRPLMPELYEDIRLIWKRDKVLSKASTVFLEKLIEVTGNRDGGTENSAVSLI